MENSGNTSIANRDHQFGIFYYLSKLGCIRRSNYEAENDESSPDADFGTHCHAWLAAYHQHQPLPEVSDVPTDDKTCSEAFLLRNYAARFGPDSLGKVLWAEGRMDGELEIGGRVYPIRGHQDLITEMDVQTVCQFARERGIELDPGIYLHDFKTKKTHSSLAVPTLLASAQPTMYVELLKQKFPEQMANFKGTLFHNLYRYKCDEDKSFQSIRVKPHDEDELTRLKWIVKHATWREETLGKQHVTPTHCFDYGRVCPLFGACKRYNEEEL